jgi:hypothetical protein
MGYSSAEGKRWSFFATRQEGISGSCEQPEKMTAVGIGMMVYVE